MRISDWSSDVCSSDLSLWLAVMFFTGALRAGLHSRALRRGTVHGIVHQGFEPVAVEAGTRVEKLVGGGEVCHQAGLRAEVCVGLSIRSCCDQLALIWGTEARITSRRLAANAGECHSMVEGLRDHPLRRSEEHTSELQSLMRTSY